MQVESLGQEDPLQEEMATHSNILAPENSMVRGASQATVSEHSFPYIFVYLSQRLEIMSYSSLLFLCKTLKGR